MKYLFTLMAALFLFACSKDPNNNQPTTAPPPPPPPTGSSKGSIIFYCQDTSKYHEGLRSVDVWLNWQNSQSVGKYLGRVQNMPSSPSQAYCGSFWGLNYSDTTASHYTYHAKQTSSPFKTWDGSFTLSPDTCIKIELVSP